MSEKGRVIKGPAKLRNQNKFDICNNLGKYESLNSGKISEI